MIYVDQEQVDRFIEALWPAVQRLAPHFGVDPRAVMREAAHRSAFGKTALHNNYFNLQGSGDKGHNIHMRAIRTREVTEGGLRPVFRKMARYSSAEAAVRDYLNRLTRGGDLAYTYSAPISVQGASS